MKEGEGGALAHFLTLEIQAVFRDRFLELQNVERRGGD
jgi:hypothetical protein